MSYLGKVYPLQVLQGTGGIPNYGAFLGTSASAELIAAINEQAGATFFGTQFADTTKAFIDKTLAPMQTALGQIRLTAEILLSPDVIRPLIVDTDFATIPPIMQLPILLYAPVRDLFNRGRVEGFGFNPEYLPEDDVYAHILSSGYVEDVLSAMDEDDMVRFHWDIRSDDPALDQDQIRAVRDTREAIDRMLENTNYDPTSYPAERG